MRKTVLKTKYTVLKSRTTKRKKMTEKTLSAILLIQLPEFTSIRTFSVRYHLALCKENWKIGKIWRRFHLHPPFFSLFACFLLGSSLRFLKLHT